MLMQTGIGSNTEMKINVIYKFEGFTSVSSVQLSHS